MKREGLDGERVVLHLGGRDAKAWPIEAWAAFLPRAAEIASGPLVLVAGAAEQDRLEALTANRSARILRAPLLSLSDLIHLLRGASAFVGCDSGVMHLAVASGTPTVALFFRSNPYHYAPLGAEHATVLLADPYGVDPAAWPESSAALPRSRLFTALPEDPRSSRLGLPETGSRAQSAVEAALREVLRGPEHVPGTSRRVPNGRTA
jgi:ADP-heptose:LPS heptosyltransferase